MAVLVEIIIGGNGIISPSQLRDILQKVEEALSGAGGTEGVIISGRLPVWAFCAITHLLHPRPFIATFEPRVGKGVVVQSHVEGLSIGDLVDIPSEKVVVEI
jgi:CRISPR-associated Csx3 family protein